jgi:hypothetical protein
MDNQQRSLTGIDFGIINGNERLGDMFIDKRIWLSEIYRPPVYNRTNGDIIKFSNYSLSNTGLIFNTKTLKYLNPYKDSENYFRIELKDDNGKSHGLFFHRLLASTFIPGFSLINRLPNHIDGNPSNNKLINLEWVSDSYNTIHAYQTGLIDVNNLCGVKHHSTWLSDMDVVHICGKLQDTSITYKNIAKEMQDVLDSNNKTITQLVSIIKDIVKGKSWKNTSIKYDFTQRRNIKRNQYS